MIRLGSDFDYENQLRLAVTFIQKFGSDSVEQWIHGFVRESIEAYRNSTNSTSCNKGIRERIATGFRRVDDELDKLFVQVEGPMLMRNWLKTWDLQDIKDEAKPKLAEQLKAKGVNEKSSVEEVVEAFRKIAAEQLAANRLQDDKSLQAEVDVYAESMIEPNYEDMLKQYVDSETSPTIGDTEESVVGLIGHP